ncbi:MAG: acyl-ACP--UDP-N-acetylglucosamine O-acyltransferase [Methyloligellaceae bacterium]
MPDIHPTAVVDSGANLGSKVEIGPYCVVGPHVTLGDKCRLRSHVVISGHTTIGSECEFFPFASIGEIPQDMKYAGEESRLVIGNNNVIRESVTINLGTQGGGLVTEIGSHVLIMAYGHVAHDCRIGDHVILANAATLGGHCVIEDHAILGGLSAVHQFVRVGTHAFVGGMSGAESDVIPFGMVIGVRGGLTGLNIVGMKRHGFKREQIQNLRKAYKILFAAEGTLAERADEMERAFPDDECVARVLQFVRSDTSRSLLVPKRNGE